MAGRGLTLGYFEVEILHVLLFRECEVTPRLAPFGEAAAPNRTGVILQYRWLLFQERQGGINRKNEVL